MVLRFIQRLIGIPVQFIECRSMRRRQRNPNADGNRTRVFSKGKGVVKQLPQPGRYFHYLFNGGNIIHEDHKLIPAQASGHIAGTDLFPEQGRGIREDFIPPADGRRYR